MNRLIGYVVLIGICLCLSVGCVTTNTSCVQSVQGSGYAKSESRQVDSFTGIDLKGNGDLYVTQGGPQEVRVVADDNLLPLIPTSVQNGVLVIGNENTCFRNTSPVKVFVKAPGIRRLTVSGSGSINSDSVIMTEALETAISGAGVIDLQVEATTLATRITGDGTATITGSVKSHTITISGNGKIFSPGLVTSTTSIDISGSGRTDVHVLDTLNLKITGSGTVNYSGNPKTVNKEVNGVAKINPV